jgi:phosphoglycolate phosphatase
MKTVLFDIDGTLILTGGAGQRAFARTFSEDFGVPLISRAVTFAGRSDRAISRDLMVVHDIEPSEANWQRFRDGYLARLPEALRAGRGQVLPGVLPLLGRLDKLPVQLGLLTGNVRAGAQQKLTYYNLWDRFAFGGFGDDHLDRNDIAVAALAAARERSHSNGNSASNGELVIVIGDTENDIRCARAIGARVVAVATGLTSATALAAEKPDLLVENLEDADVLLDWLTS